MQFNNLKSIKYLGNVYTHKLFNDIKIRYVRKKHSNFNTQKKNIFDSTYKKNVF